MKPEQTDLSGNWWKAFDPLTLKTEAEFSDAIMRFDEIISSMNTQIETARLKALQGQGDADPAWYASIQTAHSYARQKRKAIEGRKNIILRDTAIQRREAEGRMMGDILTCLTRIAAVLEKIEGGMK